MKNILCLAFVLYAYIGLSQSTANLEWFTFQPGSSSNIGKFMKIDSEDRIYAINQVGSIVRLNQLGAVIWNLPAGTIPNVIDVALDSEQNILALGHVNNTWHIMKFDSTGNNLWDEVLVITSGFIEYPNAITSDSSNNVYITGKRNTKFYTAKFASDGTFIWDSYYTGPYLPGNHEGIGIFAHSENEIYAIGYEHRNSVTEDVRLIKYDNFGNIVWSRMFSWNIWQGQSQQSNDRGKFVRTDSFGNVYVIAESTPQKVTTIKYDSSGNIQWTKPITDNLSFINLHHARDFFVDSIGNSYLTGNVYIYNSTYSYTADSIFTLKKNSSGVTEWLKFSYGGKGNALKVRNGDVYVAGQSEDCNGCLEKHLIRKYDAAGNLNWIYEVNSQNQSGGSFDIELDSEDNVYVTGAQNTTAQNTGCSYNYKLFPCENIEYDAYILNDTIWSNNNGNLYKYMDCFNSYPLVNWNNNNFFVPPSVGSYAIITKRGVCIDTSDCIDLGFTTSNSLSVCKGENVTFPDGSTIFNIQTDTTQTSNLIAQNNIDSTVITTVFVEYIDLVMVVDSTNILAIADSVTFQWLACDNGMLEILNATDSIYYPLIAGNYAVVIESTACVDTSDCYHIEIPDQNVSVYDVEYNSNINYYPNPSTDVIYVNLGNNESVVKIIIQDMTGKVVDQLEYSNCKQLKVSIENLTNGIYIMKVMYSDKMNQLQFVKR